MDEENVAIYLDFENLVISSEETYPSKEKPMQMGPIVDFANSKGNIIVKKAYADWSVGDFSSYQGALIKHGFELVHLPATSAQGKNGSDVKLAIDVMKHLDMLKNVDIVIIGSGDTDFVPLIQYIRSRGKRVVVVGFDHSVGDLVKRNATEFRSLIEIYGMPEDGAMSGGERKEGDRGRSLLLRFIRIGDTDEPIYLGNLKENLMRLDSSFSERKFDFSSFKKYIESFKGDLVESLERSEDGHPMVKLVDMKNLDIKEKSTFEEAKRYLDDTLKFISDSKKREKLASALYNEMKRGKAFSMKEMEDYLFSKKIGVSRMEIKKYIFMLFKSGSFTKRNRDERGPLMNRKLKLKKGIKGPAPLEQNYIDDAKESLSRHFPDLGDQEISDLINY